MREVVNAAEGGRLVMLGVLAPTSMQALRAIVGRGSAGGDAQTRLALATSFRVAFAYRVLQRLGGGRLAVRDLVVGTSEVSAMLASGDFPGIARLQREGGDEHDHRGRFAGACRAARPPVAAAGGVARRGQEVSRRPGALGRRQPAGRHETALRGLAPACSNR